MSASSQGDQVWLPLRQCFYFKPPPIDDLRSSPLASTTSSRRRLRQHHHKSIKYGFHFGMLLLRTTTDRSSVSSSSLFHLFLEMTIINLFNNTCFRVSKGNILTSLDRFPKSILKSCIFLETVLQISQANKISN